MVSCGVPLVSLQKQPQPGYPQDTPKCIVRGPNRSHQPVFLCEFDRGCLRKGWCLEAIRAARGFVKLRAQCHSAAGD